MQLRKKRNKSKKEPVWRSQLALRAYPDDRLVDRGGTRPRFVERGYPPQTLSSPSQSLYMDMGMVMPKKGVPRDVQWAEAWGARARQRAMPVGSSECLPLPEHLLLLV